MTDHLTDEELAALEAAMAGITPGPWTQWKGNPWHLESPIETDAHGLNRKRVVCGSSAGDGTFWEPGMQDQIKRDMAFIAAARDAMPRLIAEIRSLHAENEKLRKMVGGPSFTVGPIE